MPKHNCGFPGETKLLIPSHSMADSEKTAMPGIGYRRNVTNARPPGSAFETAD
ncbi:MAG: hypothetical protein MJ078_04160 [Clostridia bacterium]|nr:hypothetical protein [Clostridia bacterium]